MKNLKELFRFLIGKLRRYFMLLICKKYILDVDTNIIHRISKIDDKCEIEKVTHYEYLSNTTCKVYKIYDFSYKDCSYCNKYDF